MADTGGVARQDMVFIAPECWAGLLDRRDDLRAMPLVAEWAERQRPLIVRRPCPDDAPDLVPLGLPLPPAQGKRRIRLALPTAAIVARQPPPTLASARASAPRDWHRAIDAVAALDSGTRVFGSLAWEHLTGLPYLASTSDLDLLWAPRDAAGVERLVAGLSAIQKVSPMRIDGEILAPDGAAVQWREWAGDAPDLLIKLADRIDLVDRAAFRARFG
jgi:phosphoribosyl-dephospho-CoA transferase